MASPLTIPGANCRIYLNNKVYSVAQSVTLEVDEGVYEVYGINAPYPQELASGQIHVRGNIKGIRLKQSGGLQGSNAIPLFSDIISGNYISLRLEDRSTQETIWSVTTARINNVSEVVQIKGIYQVTFSFVGQIPFRTLDLS